MILLFLYSLDLQECMVDQGVMVAMVWALEATVEVVVAEDMAIMDHLGEYLEIQQACKLGCLIL